MTGGRQPMSTCLSHVGNHNAAVMLNTVNRLSMRQQWVFGVINNAILDIIKRQNRQKTYAP